MANDSYPYHLNFDQPLTASQREILDAAVNAAVERMNDDAPAEYPVSWLTTTQDGRVV